MSIRFSYHLKNDGLLTKEQQEYNLKKLQDYGANQKFSTSKTTASTEYELEKSDIYTSFAKCKVFVVVVSI